MDSIWSEEMDVKIVIAAIMETVAELKGYECKLPQVSFREDGEWKKRDWWPKSRPFTLHIKAILEREDGHTKENTICEVQWRYKDYLILSDPQSANVISKSTRDYMEKHYPKQLEAWMPPERIYLADPNWGEKFKKFLPKFRAKAASRKGQNGKKFRRNKLKWK